MEWLILLIVAIVIFGIGSIRDLVKHHNKKKQSTDLWCKDCCVPQEMHVTGACSIDNSEIIAFLEKPFNIPPSSISEHFEYILTPGSGRISEMDYAECLLRAKDFESINFNNPIHIYDTGNEYSIGWRSLRDSKGRYIKKELASQLSECSNWNDINYILIDNKFYILHNHKIK